MRARHLTALVLTASAFGALSAQLGPSVYITSAKLDFSSVSVGSVSSPRKIGIANTSAIPLEMHGTSTTDSTVFPVRDDCPTVLAPSQHCTVVVLFVPGKAGSATGKLDFGDHSPDGSHSVPISGTGVNP